MKQHISGWTNMLEGKLAVVTGAARGIGRAAAVALAQSGARVVGIDICKTVDPRSGVTPARREDLDKTRSLVDAVVGLNGAQLSPRVSMTLDAYGTTHCCPLRRSTRGRVSPFQRPCAARLRRD
jgi:NAD(P)-dependent dehydrogenase (short-subunit alcohol dehydrogenase family)